MRAKPAAQAGGDFRPVGPLTQIILDVSVYGAAGAVFPGTCEGDSPIFAAATVAHCAKRSWGRENWDSPPVNGYGTSKPRSRPALSTSP